MSQPAGFPHQRSTHSPTGISSLQTRLLPFWRPIGKSTPYSFMRSAAAMYPAEGLTTAVHLPLHLATLAQQGLSCASYLPLLTIQ